MREARLREMEEHLTNAVAAGPASAASATEELRESFALLLEEECAM